MSITHRSKHVARTPAGLVLIALFALAACAPRTATGTPVDSTIRSATAFVGDLAASASASGLLLPEREARLAIGIPGRVYAVYVQVGDEVSAGEVVLELDRSELERAVESAAQNLAISEANLASLRRDASPADLAAARAAVDSAQAQLEDLRAGPTESEVAQAQAAVVSAQARLDDLLAGPTEQELAQAQANVSSARANLQSAETRAAALEGQVLIAQNDVHNAQLAIDRARDAYNQLIWHKPEVATSWGPYSPQAAALQVAQINYDAALANLTLARIDVNDASLRAAQTQVAQAEAALVAVQERQSSQIAAARAQVARAEANLAALMRPHSAQVAAARAQVAQATANLARLQTGPSAEQTAIAESQVAQARISLEDTLHNLRSASLTAPFAGTVTAVHVAPGELASGLAVELVDTQTLRVVLDVDEIDIGAIRVGQPALVTIETWPDRRLSGTVIWIAPKAKVVAGIVTYEVDLSLDAGDLPVLTGMTATAELITAQREDVLLVPNRSVIADRSQSKYYVQLVEGDTTTKTEVTIGLRDSMYTEITSGLRAGDVVLIDGIEAGIDWTAGPPEHVREMSRP